MTTPYPDGRQSTLIALVQWVAFLRELKMRYRILSPFMDEIYLPSLQLVHPVSDGWSGQLMPALTVELDTKMTAWPTLRDQIREYVTRTQRPVLLLGDVSGSGIHTYVYYAAERRGPAQRQVTLMLDRANVLWLAPWNPETRSGTIRNGTFVTSSIAERNLRVAYAAANKIPSDAYLCSICQEVPDLAPLKNFRCTACKARSNRDEITRARATFSEEGFYDPLPAAIWSEPRPQSKRATRRYNTTGRDQSTGAKFLLFLVGIAAVFVFLVLRQPTTRSTTTNSSAAARQAGPAPVQAIDSDKSTGQVFNPPDLAPQVNTQAGENPSIIDSVPLPAFVPTGDSQDLVVVTWNVGMDDADPAVVADRIGRFQDVDLWALQEVTIPSYAPVLEAAAEQGESADFSHVLGESGNDIRLLSLYNNTRFELVESAELTAINTTGNARAPLVLHLRHRESGSEFLFVNNHLYRSRDDERLRQARLLNQWAVSQTLPVITAGDFNYDWDVANGASRHDPGFDAMTAGNVWAWVQPDEITTTQCSGWPCRYNSVLDFVFTAGAARKWEAQSAIIVEPGDFPDDTTTSDHRPVLARFVPANESTDTVEQVAELPIAPIVESEPLEVVAALPEREVSASTALLLNRKPNVVIENVLYDGQVYRVESDEYAVIANLGSQPATLTGWTLDAGGSSQRFIFPSFSLPPGARIRVYTNETHPESGGFSFGITKAIWNNKGDCGKLYDSDMNLISQLCY